ncbi:MAG: hypothetical protein WA397_26270 [Roseiarcus sp.]
MVPDAMLRSIAENLAALNLEPLLHLKIVAAVVAPLVSGEQPEAIPREAPAEPARPPARNTKEKGAPKAKKAKPNGDAGGDKTRGLDGRFVPQEPRPSSSNATRKWHHNNPAQNIPDKTIAATALLREALSGGPRPATDIDELAERRGVSVNALGRAKNELGVIARRLDRGAGHVVHLFLPQQRVNTELAAAQ